MSTAVDHSVEVLGPQGHRHDEILTPEALEFVGRLHAAFEERRRALLAERRRRALRLASGEPLDFSVATTRVREDPDWRVAPPAPGLADRRVEITGPPTPVTAADALASGAQVWVADFEDATAPTWENVLGGQLTLRDAVERRPGVTAPHANSRSTVGDVTGPYTNPGCTEGDFTGPYTNPGCTEGDFTAPCTNSPTGDATLVVRPRGWHLTEDHLRVAGVPVSASLVDFGLYFFHCAQRQIDVGSGPYFSLPKLENHYEARLWNDVFVLAQHLLGIPCGTVRATALIETVTAAFEAEEILYELREHSAGLGTGHRDHLFSVVKSFAHRPDFVLPDRANVTPTAPFLRACAELVVRTCHKRGAHAVGAAAAQVPSGDPHADQAALARVRLDKEREAEDGFDGSQVAHPALVPVCREAFTGVLGRRPHQIERTRNDVHVTARDLLAVRRTAGRPTPEGVRAAVATALRCIDAWMRGQGVLALDGLREDTATVETARCQLWQWLRHGATDRATVRGLLDRECAVLAKETPDALAVEARAVLERVALARELPAFFTTAAYADHLVRTGERSAEGSANVSAGRVAARTGGERS